MRHWDGIAESGLAYHDRLVLLKNGAWEPWEGECAREFLVAGLDSVDLKCLQ